MLILQSKCAGLWHGLHSYLATINYSNYHDCLLYAGFFLQAMENLNTRHPGLSWTEKEAQKQIEPRRVSL